MEHAADVVFAADTFSGSGGSLNVDTDNKGSSSVGTSYSRSNGVPAGVAMKRQARERLWSTAIAAFVASIPALLVGYTLGFPSSALLDLTGNGTADIPSSYVFSSTLGDIFAALASVGAVFGGLIAGPIADRWGRKNALVLCGIPYFVGYLTLTYAHYLPTAASFKTIVLLGRFLTGVGMGWACMSGSVYIGEIASAKFRGVFGSFFQIGLASGILVNYAIGSIPHFSYYNSALVAAGIAALFELLAVMLYETPRWLVSQGLSADAWRSLRWLRGPSVDIEPELQAAMAVQSTSGNLWESLKEFRRRSVAVPLVLVIFVMFFQQAGGLNVLTSFAASIFQEAGVSNPRITATYAIGGLEFAAAFVVVCVIDNVGRKFLLLLGGVGMFVGTLLLGVDFYLTRPSVCSSNGSSNSTILLDKLGDDSEAGTCNSQYGPLAVVSIMTYILGFSIGWGPIPWILAAELMPLRVRGAASGIATITNWGTSALVAGVYGSYARAVSTWIAWWSFAALNLCAVVFVGLFLRETKGKTLEEIETHYQRNVL